MLQQLGAYASHICWLGGMCLGGMCLTFFIPVGLGLAGLLCADKRIYFTEGALQRRVVGWHVSQKLVTSASCLVDHGPMWLALWTLHWL